MDNLTHALAGIMLSRAGLSKFSPRSALILALAASMPDIDILTLTLGEQTYLDVHRGVTHGIALAPIMAVPPVLAAGLLRRPREFPWRRAFCVSLIGVASHLLLDWTNIYGIRLLAPFSARWFRLEITSVIDLWIWAVLLLSSLWMVLARLVSSEIGAQRGAGSGIARFALAFLLVYDGGRYFLHLRALETMNAWMYEGVPPKRVAAMPHFANPFQWRGLIELPQGWRLADVDLRQEFDPASGHLYYHPSDTTLIEAARATPPFQTLLRFSDMTHWAVVPRPEPEGSWEVRAVDLRFAVPGEGRFQSTAWIDAAGRVTKAWFQFDPPGAMPRPR